MTSTAFGAATMKAFEGHARPDQRLFDDPLAEEILHGIPALVVRHAALRVPVIWVIERFAPGMIGGLVCRTRAIDDACRDAIRSGCTQVVILGAGLDTRAYRLASMQDVGVWELDLPTVSKVKQAAVLRVLGRLSSRVRYVPVDFTREALGSALDRAGFETAGDCRRAAASCSPTSPGQSSTTPTTRASYGGSDGRPDSIRRRWPHTCRPSDWNSSTIWAGPSTSSDTFARYVGR